MEQNVQFFVSLFEEILTYVYKEACTKIFAAALFVITTTEINLSIHRKRECLRNYSTSVT